MFKKVKKLLIVAMAMILGLFAFCACNDETEPENIGEFYDLSEAYEQGLVSKTDVLNIAYQYDGSIQQEGFVPYEITPLDKETENKIKETWFNYRKKDNDIITIDDVIIEGYYGTYNGKVALLIKDTYIAFATMRTEISVGGVDFIYPVLHTIMIWIEK